MNRNAWHKAKEKLLMSTTITEEIIEVQDFATTGAIKDTRTVETIEVGQHVRQGDIYVERTARLSGKGSPTTERKLAPGETQGSRHMIVGDVDVYARSEQGIVEGKLLGPEIDAKDSVRIAHPEHADIELPAGTYQVFYQQDPASKQRVID